MNITYAKPTRAAGLLAALSGLLFMAAEAPQFVDSFLGIFNGSGTEIGLGTLGVALLPHTLGRYAAVPVGLALIWLGYSLWSEQRKNSKEPTAAAHSSHLHQTPAV